MTPERIYRYSSCTSSRFHMALQRPVYTHPLECAIHMSSDARHCSPANFIRPLAADCHCRNRPHTGSLPAFHHPEKIWLSRI